MPLNSKKPSRMIKVSKKETQSTEGSAKIAEAPVGSSRRFHFSLYKCRGRGIPSFSHLPANNVFSETEGRHGSKNSCKNHLESCEIEKMVAIEKVKRKSFKPKRDSTELVITKPMKEELAKAIQGANKPEFMFLLSLLNGDTERDINLKAETKENVERNHKSHSNVGSLGSPTNSRGNYVKSRGKEEVDSKISNTEAPPMNKVDLSMQMIISEAVRNDEADDKPSARTKLLSNRTPAPHVNLESSKIIKEETIEKEERKSLVPEQDSAELGITKAMKEEIAKAIQDANKPEFLFLLSLLHDDFEELANDLQYINPDALPTQTIISEAISIGEASDKVERTSEKPNKHDTIIQTNDQIDDSPFSGSTVTVETTDHEFHEYSFEITELSSEELSQAQEDSEAIRASDSRILSWSSGNKGNIRSLLSTLQSVLWSESGWKKVPLVDLIKGNAVKRAYQKAMLCLHPDKLQQKGASAHQKYLAEKVFDILQEAWDHFSLLESL